MCKLLSDYCNSRLVAASLRTVRFVQDFQPTMIVLAGIAAGWREKQRRGSVVLPRNILDVAQSEAKEGGFVPRPDHHRLPEVIAQMMRHRFDDESLSALTKKIYGGWPSAKKGHEEQLKNEVAIPPKVDECVIACGDILVRRAGALKTWQKTDPQVRAFEMDSGGKIRAISDFRNGIPWLRCVASRILATQRKVTTTNSTLPPRLLRMCVSEGGFAQQADKEIKCRKDDFGQGRMIITEVNVNKLRVSFPVELCGDNAALKKRATR